MIRLRDLFKCEEQITFFMILRPVFTFMIISLSSCTSPAPKLRIGCKNFTEQLILAEIIAQTIERENPQIPIDKKWGFGSTPMIHQALVHGEIDLYFEYTGTAEQVILKSEKKLSLTDIDNLYRSLFKAQWFPSLGFSNGYVLVVRQESALPKKLSQCQSLTDHLKAGMNAEYANRADGFPLIQKRYDLHFKSIKNLDVGLLYSALESQLVDIISGFSTDAKLSTNQFRIVEDDLQISPRYEPCPVIRIEALKRFPDLAKTLDNLSGIISESMMQNLNAQVEIKHQSPSRVAQEFLIKSNP